MKKPTNHKKTQNPDMLVKTSLPDLGILLYLVEMLAARRNESGYTYEKVPVGWQAIETSTIEAYVNGNTDVTTGEGMSNSSFTSSFLFTCLKIKGQDYRFNWLCSLS